MVKTIILLCIFALAIASAGWVAIKVYYFIRKENDLERKSNLEVKIQAEDLLAELDAATRRFNKGKNHEN